MKAKKLFESTLPLWENYDLEKARPYLKGVSEGAMRDIKDKKKVGYYQWLPALIEKMEPSQIIELGGAMGASALMMLSSLPKVSMLYSVTLEENGLEFSFIKEKYPNFVPIVGNDLDLGIWPEDLDLGKTDIWFIDSEHSYEQLTAERKLYEPYFKKGAIILLDDIHLNEGMFKAWTEFEGDKFDASTWLHWSGFGLIVI